MAREVVEEEVVVTREREYIACDSCGQEVEDGPIFDERDGDTTVAFCESCEDSQVAREEGIFRALTSGKTEYEYLWLEEAIVTGLFFLAFSYLVDAPRISAFLFSASVTLLMIFAHFFSYDSR